VPSIRLISHLGTHQFQYFRPAAATFLLLEAGNPINYTVAFTDLYRIQRHCSYVKLALLQCYRWTPKLRRLAPERHATAPVVTLHHGYKPAVLAPGTSL
jgi:hypothetical protein